MFMTMEQEWNVVAAMEMLDPRGLVLQRSIVVRLLEQFAEKKATKDAGYLVAITTLERVGEGKVRRQTAEVVFPVRFTCITFKPLKGEVLLGVVHKIMKHGVILRCGPVENIYLSNQKMKGYTYIPGDDPSFIHDKMGTIEKDVTLRFLIIGTKWMEVERDFQALASLDSDFLGPIS